MDDIVGVVETGVYVDDLDRAEAFYRDVLGLQLLFREEGRHVFFQAGDRNVLLLFRADACLKGDVLPPHGCTGAGHFALGVPAGSLPRWRERLQRYSVAIEKEVEWPLGGLSLYFRDPAGNSVELITPRVWGLPTGW